MKNEIKINDSKSLKIFLSNLVKESVSDALESTSPYTLKEQEDLPDFLKGDDEEANSEEKAEVKSEVETEEEVQPREDLEASPGSLFKLINSVRSGKSIKAGDVRDQLRLYFENLGDAEQIALIEFLQGLSDIIVRGESADEAEDPSEEVKMTSKVEVEVQDDKKESTPEDTSPPIKAKGV